MRQLDNRAVFGNIVTWFGIVGPGFATTSFVVSLRVLMNMETQCINYSSNFSQSAEMSIFLSVLKSTYCYAAFNNK